MGTEEHYKRLPYAGRAHRLAHIDQMAMCAGLFSLPATPVRSARVLELGCADGTNLINMAAYLPGSEFIGLDLFSGHIETGRETAAALSLHNVTLLCGDLCAPPEELGTFDYILAHGVYSWVPKATREALLALVRARLRPEGLALVSYNTEPGWSSRRPIRELMLWHTRDLIGAAAEVAEARAIVRLVREAQPDAASSRSRRLDAVLTELDAASDDYIYHEYLEPDNHPVWFHDFAQHAANHGLQYVGESTFQAMLADRFDDQTRQALHQLGQNLVDFEQYLDFLCGRRFRSSLLTHHERDIDRTISLQPLLSLAFALPLDTPGEPDDDGGVTYTHRSHPDLTVRVTAPLHQETVAALAACYPQALRFSELVAHTSAVLGQEADAVFQTTLADLLMQLFRQSAAELFSEPPPVTATISECPLAPPLVRRQAARDQLICTPRHEMFRLNPLEAAVASRLDGRHSHEDLAIALTPMLTTDNAPELADLSPRDLARQIVAQTLARLARDGMLSPQ
jgi:methyltransferase-like protein/2-polyprenyl-3-methyl-5-hydroxy-6-metoxy-1,4-benzoquinol methylase